jgi:hypothetical protein
VAFVAFGLSPAFKLAYGLIARRRRSGFQVAFEWLSVGFCGFRPVHDFYVGSATPAPSIHVQPLLWRIVCILDNSLEGMVVDILIYIEVAEVIECRRVMELPRNKLVPEVR